jgi:DNA-binding winged helix-turn-helix (wHTH) protein/Tol biopolymer transport system component
LPDKIRFGVYELDRDAMELRRNGVPIRLQEQPLQVLATLVERPGEIITREELQERVWGKDTFVDFEQSLNKAVNRLREALNDEAGQPKYVETVPRRGYRFIAPVIGLPMEQPTPLQTPVSEAELAKPALHRKRIVSMSLLAAFLVVALGIASFLLGRRPEKTRPVETKHMASAAFCCPALSRDGKLLAYVSDAGVGVVHVWVQQTAGGQAIQVTRGSEGELGPDFSPDGAHITFVSWNGNIYIAPALSGEPKQIAKAHGGYPLFSPNGEKILYWEDNDSITNNKAMTVSADGGEPTSLDVNRDFLVHFRPLWSPDGDAILFYGVRKREPDKPDEWWVAPLTGGEARPVNLPGEEQDFSWESVRTWIRDKDGAEWIIYSVAKGELWQLFRLRLSSQGQISGKSELVTSGTGRLGYGLSVSEDGTLVYTTQTFTESIYEIPIDSRGQKSGPTVQLPLLEGVDYRSPSLSRDGRWLAYDAVGAGESSSIRLKDLNSGADRLLDDKGRHLDWGGGGSNPGSTGARETTISPDGSKVTFERECKSGKWANDGGPLPCDFMIPAAGGEPEQVCDYCTPRGFSSNGAVVLIQQYNRNGTAQPPQSIAAIDLKSKTEKGFLATPDKVVAHAYFSWDDRWVVFKKELDDLKSQIMIAPVRDGVAGKEAEWIAVTDGQYDDDKPQFSPDGNTVYFLSAARDGYLCIWSQRLDPVTKRPVGVPIGYEHFHSLAQRELSPYSHVIWSSDLTVARDKMMVNLPQFGGEIWMTQIE